MSLRALRRAVEGIDEPRPRPQFRAQLVRQLEAGQEKVLPLPVTQHPVPRRRGGRWQTAAAISAIFAVGAYQAVNTRGLESAASELVFMPSNPQAGDSITVRYRPTGELAGEERVVLRGQLWTRDDVNSLGAERTPVDTLARVGRHFEGRFRFPDRVVFGQFAVEDLRGMRLDSRGWKLLVHGQNGVPTFNALTRQRRALETRSWPAALKVANETVMLYPNHPEAWASLAALERRYYGLEGFDSDSLRGKHEAAFRRLDSLYGPGQTAPADDVGWMYWYAWTLEFNEELEVWKGRVLADAPSSARATFIRWTDAFTRMESVGINATLRELEGVWRASLVPDEDLAAAGYAVARTLGLPSEVRTWGERRMALAPDLGLDVVRDFARLPVLRALAVDWLRKELVRTDQVPPAHRSLYRTVAQQHANDGRYRHKVLAALGTTLIEDGVVPEGLRYLDEAADIEWNSAVFAKAGDAKLALGDTAGAVTMWAKVAVDPKDGRQRVDSITERVLEWITFHEWRGQLEEARTEMHQRTLDTARRRSLPREVRVSDASGAVRSIADLAVGREAVVAFWSRFAAADDLPALNQLADRLRRRGATVIAVTNEPPSPALDAYIAENKLFDLPIFFDQDGEAERAFKTVGMLPVYYVLDSSGHVFFEGRPINDLDRQVAALQADAERMATDLIAPESD